MTGLSMPMDVVRSLVVGNVVRMGCPLPGLDPACMEYRVDRIGQRDGTKSVDLTAFYMGLEMLQVTLAGTVGEDFLTEVRL